MFFAAISIASDTFRPFRCQASTRCLSAGAVRSDLGSNMKPYCRAYSCAATTLYLWYRAIFPQGLQKVCRRMAAIVDLCQDSADVCRISKRK